MATALTAAAEGRKRRAAVHPTSWPGGCCAGAEDGGEGGGSGGGSKEGREEWLGQGGSKGAGRGGGGGLRTGLARSTRARSGTRQANAPRVRVH